jgi:hypothetical protein
VVRLSQKKRKEKSWAPVACTPSYSGGSQF